MRISGHEACRAGGINLARCGRGSLLGELDVGQARLAPSPSDTPFSPTTTLTSLRFIFTPHLRPHPHQPSPNVTFTLTFTLTFPLPGQVRRRTPRSLGARHLAARRPR